MRRIMQARVPRGRRCPPKNAFGTSVLSKDVRKNLLARPFRCARVRRDGRDRLLCRQATIRA
ncbi:hypothetical protein LP420_03415 [Massilia sp. B-10]|nr:hypothetical protein LP420_03415 [Massilia sp. B-10]